MTCYNVVIDETNYSTTKGFWSYLYTTGDPYSNGGEFNLSSPGPNDACKITRTDTGFKFYSSTYGTDAQWKGEVYWMAAPE